MAEAVVSFVLEKIGELVVDSIIEEALFRYGVKDQVDLAKRELQQMLCFLRDADAHVRGGNATKSLGNWVAEIREAAYDLQDVLTTFASEVASRRTGGVKDVVKRYACIVNEGVKLYQVGSKIKKISTRISVLGSSLQNYNLRKLENAEGASSSNEWQRDLRRAYSHVVEHDIVGFDGNIKELVAHLTKTENSQYRVVSICGMGGLGKTTLARKIYQHDEIRRHFDCVAWASISQQCQVNDVLKEILSKLCVGQKEKIEQMQKNEIVKRLYEVQKEKRCLVVLDDIWTTQMWDLLKAAFPDYETNSKVLLTTRNKELASHADRNAIIYEPQCLDDNQSWELFEKGFGADGLSTNLEKRMKEIVEEMLKYCGGLPLAIIMLRELLWRKKAMLQWEELRKNAKTYINKGKAEELRDSKHLGVSWVLGLSYDELPYKLKSCFLQLAHFPEDYEIRVDELCQIWMAEGFVSSEDVAYECLYELIQRCMVQRGKLSLIDERIKTCRLHDLIRDMCSLKAQEENFLRISTLVYRQETMSSVVSSKVRRLGMIYLNRDTVANHDQLLAVIRGGCLRSFVCFDQYFPPKKVQPWFRYFALLRVLKFEKVQVAFKLPKEIGKLIQLRFLSLKGCKVEQLPSSINNLTSLQTLDIRVDVLITLYMRNDMRGLEQLRHLYLPDYYELHSGKILLLASNLKTLVNINTRYSDLDGLVQPTNLTKLRVQYGEYWQGGVIFSSVQSLTVEIWGFENTDIRPIISSCPGIYKLKVLGETKTLPEEIPFPSNIVKLTLERTSFRNDPMPTLGKLPKLRILRLLEKTFLGGEVVCSKGDFPQLESLHFSRLFWFEEWRVEEGALPSLRHLSIRECFYLRTLPDGLRNVSTLKEIVVGGMPREFEMRLKEGGEDFYKVQHVPSLVFLNTF